MNVKLISLSRAAGLLAGAFLSLVGVRAAETDAMPVFENNYLQIGGTAPSVSGSSAAFQKKTLISKSGAGGVEAFNYTVDLSKVTTLQVDAKALPGAEDYLAQFKVTKNEVGSFEAGYKRVRTFYDGLGGFFPGNNNWIPLYSRALNLDRGKFFVNATIALPKAPVFTFSYTNETRSGRKDSTIWGDSDLTGVTIFSNTALNLISSNRKFVPAYIQLNERRETWEAAVKQTFGATTVRLAVAGDRINNLDARSVDRYPGELKPFPAIPSAPLTVVPNALGNNPNKGFDQQGVKETGLTWSGKIETKLSDLASLYTEASYHHANVDTTGSRLITASILTGTGLQNLVGGFTPAGRPPYSQVGSGNMKEDVYTGVVGMELKPTKNLEISPAVKFEDSRTSGNYLANYVSNMVVLATGVVTPVPLAAPNSSNISEKPVVPELSLRYSGIQDVALFAMWDYRSTPSDERKSYVGITTSTGPVVLAAPTLVFDKVKEKHTNFKVGANWTPNSALTLRAEFFEKDHENNFNDALAAGYYTLDYDTYGARFTATVRPSPVVSFATRYLVQRGHGTVAEDGYLFGHSNDSRSYQISETVDWNPTKLFYGQANVNVVWETVGTVYPRAGGAANDVLHNADLNFWNASVLAGFVVDKATDAQVQATYYKADNYNPDLAVTTMPYGEGGSDYSFTVGLKHKFSDRIVGNAKLGYFKNTSDTTGGLANYKGTVGYVSVQFRL